MAAKVQDIINLVIIIIDVRYSALCIIEKLMIAMTISISQTSLVYVNR